MPPPEVSNKKVQDEIQNLIEGSGQVLSDADLNQVGKAIASYVSNGDFYTDSGGANTYNLSPVASNQLPVDFRLGMSVKFIASFTNMGPSVVNIDPLGIAPIATLPGFTFLVGGEIQVGDYVKLFLLPTGNPVVPQVFILEKVISAQPITGFPESFPIDF